jgi:hypothetical protein
LGTAPVLGIGTTSLHLLLDFELKLCLAAIWDDGVTLEQTDYLRAKQSTES